MPQHEDLDLLRPLRTTKENEKLEQTADHPVSKGQALKQQTPSTHPSTLSRSKHAHSLLRHHQAEQERRSGARVSGTHRVFVRASEHQRTRANAEPCHSCHRTRPVVSS